MRYLSVISTVFNLTVLTQHIQSGRSLDFSEFIFYRYPVDARVVGRYVRYFQGPVVIVFPDLHPTVDANRSAVLLP